MYRIEEIQIDTNRACLIREGVEVHLRRKSFQVLAYLVANRDRLVLKEELFENLWPGTAVTDDVLVQCIRDVRRALDDDPQHPKFIKTIPRSGYRFIAPVDSNGFSDNYTEEITRVEFEIEEEIDVPVRRTLSPVRGQRRMVVASTVCMLAFLIAAALYFWLPQTTSRADIRLPKVEGRQAVAVMYFENTSGDKDLDWLSEGLSDMLITNLSRSDRLTVMSRQQLAALLERQGRSTSSGFDTALDVASKSGAEMVISGSFARFGEKVRVEVQVHETASGSLRAAESLTVGRLEDVIAQIDILSIKLARDLNADAPAFDSSLAAVMTDDLEAYRYYSLGVAKAYAVEYKEAIELLNTAVRLDPDFAMAHARIGYVYAVTWGLPEEGKPHLERAFKASSRLTPRDRQNIAAWYAIANRDYPAAIEAYRTLRKQYPLETESYWRLSRLLGGEQRTDEAIDVVRQGITVDPEAKNLYNSLGGYLSVLGKHAEAIAAHQRYVALSPNEPNAYDSLGLTYEWAGDRDRAMEQFRRAIEINPKFDIAVIHLAYCQIRSGEYRNAIQTIEKYRSSVNQPGEIARSYDALSYVYYQLGDLNAAEKATDRHIELNPNGSPWVAHMIAIAKGQSEKARKLENDVNWISNLSDRGSRGNPRFGQYFRGMIALENGRDDEALGQFRETLAHRPPTWHYDDFEDCLGRAYLRLGRFDEAIAEFGRVLEYSPNYPRAHYHIARAYRAKGMTDEARSNYQLFLSNWATADADLPEIVEARSF